MQLLGNEQNWQPEKKKIKIGFTSSRAVRQPGALPLMQPMILLRLNLGPMVGLGQGMGVGLGQGR